MLCKSTKKYIFNESKKYNVAIPDNYEDVLNEYCKIAKDWGYTLIFKSGRGNDSDKLGANAGLFYSSPIIATPEWAARLILFPSEEVRNAFKITLGHEITHKENDIPILSFGIYHKFAAFVNEVHADFGGTQKMMNSSRQKLVQAIDYKRQKKLKDIGNWCHPSWGRRRYYAENYNFDNELIKQIAKDVNCSNQKIIEKACNHFEEIKLIPSLTHRQACGVVGNCNPE